MNRRIILLAALVAFAGCRNTEQEVLPGDTVKTVHFRAGTAETRTAFAAPENGLYRTLWTENDSEVLLSLNYGEAVPSAITASADGATASFDASFDASSVSAPYTFYAVSPASAARAISPSRRAWSVYIAADQTPLPTSVDEAAQLLVAKSAATPALPEEVDLHFSHLTAYGRVTLDNLALGEAVVQRVELTFSTPVVGEWYWGEDGTLTSNGASHTITLHTDASGELWFACAPVSVGGETLSLRVYTDRSFMTKEIAFPEGRSFGSGKVARFSVDMADADVQDVDDTFVLLTDASTLSAGDEILVVNLDGDRALGPQDDTGTPHRAPVAAIVTDGRIVDLGDATVLSLGPGVSAGTWALHTGTGFLTAAATKNVLQESSIVDHLSSWTITVSDGVATIAAEAGDASLIRYNSIANRFSCFKSTVATAKEVRIYRRFSKSASPLTIDPITSQDAYGSYLAGAGWTYAEESDQILRHYTQDGTVSFVLLNASDRRQLEVTGYDPTLSKGAPVTVSVRYREGKRVVLSQSYDLVVVKEDGPKVWLGDGSGQGIILKK